MSDGKRDPLDFVIVDDLVGEPWDDARRTLADEYLSAMPHIHMEVTTREFDQEEYDCVFRIRPCAFHAAQFGLKR